MPLRIGREGVNRMSAKATAKVLTTIAGEVLAHNITVPTHAMIEATVRDCVPLIKATELERLMATVALMKRWPEQKPANGQKDSCGYTPD